MNSPGRKKRKDAFLSISLAIIPILMVGAVIYLATPYKYNSTKAPPKATPIKLQATPAPAPEPEKKQVADKTHVPNTWGGFLESTYSEDVANTAWAQKLINENLLKGCETLGIGLRKKTVTRKTETLRAYLLEKKHLNGIDLGQIADQYPAIGMTPCGIAAALGQPIRINHHNIRGQNSFQFVIDRRGRDIYIYLDQSDGNNIIVTSYSN